jgi:peptidoglycan/xylan/chitin deacetylase (PgdA/CDA1 family)
MGERRRRRGRGPLAALLAGAFTVGLPAVQAAPSATVPVPKAAASVASSCPASPYGVHHYAPGTGKTIALTFDDGPGANSRAVLVLLQAHRVAGTFFNIGVNQAVSPATVVTEKTHGFLLGNHTWSHPDMVRLSASAQAAEMDKASTEQSRIVGGAPCFFRPPYGSYNNTTLALARARHMSVWNWSVDTEDWKARGSASSVWVKRIISRAEAGSSQTHPVILMHNARSGDAATVAALPTIIVFYRDRGYTFVDLTGRSSRAVTRRRAAESPSTGFRTDVRNRG